MTVLQLGCGHQAGHYMHEIHSYHMILLKSSNELQSMVDAGKLFQMKMGKS